MNTRELALRILIEMEQKDAQSHRLLQDTWKKYPELTDQDRRFILRLVQGTLEKRMLLDARINRKSKLAVNKMKPMIRQLLRMSAYQIFFMDKVPDGAVCNEAVKLVVKFKMQGLKGFVNGVLRAMAREEHWPEESPLIMYSMPEWIYRSWETAYGEETALCMMQASDEKHRLYFRILGGAGNPEGVSEEMIRDSLDQCHVVYHPAAFPAGAWIMENPEQLESLEALKRGWIQIQDISSMLVGVLSGVKENMQILDVCAAPGGKTLHMAEKLQGTGGIISCDLTDAKVSLILENIERSGWKNIEAVRQDARRFHPVWENRMDLVLADLPCSGLGVLGRKPEIRYRTSMEDIRSLAALQREILQNVSRYVKPGGRLVFSTCTVTSEENAQNRNWILEHLPFDAADLPLEELPEEMRGRAAGGQIQLLPGIDPCDGFYISVFRKRMDG